MNSANRTARFKLFSGLFCIIAFFLLARGLNAQEHPAPRSEQLPTGASITPTAVPGSRLELLKPGIPGHANEPAGDAMTIATSPDGKTMLVLTSGYNQWYNSAGKVDRPASTEWIFVFDISSGSAKEVQALSVPNAFGGMVWNPTGNEFYVAGGVDDVLHTYAHQGAKWAESGKAIPLRHAHGLGIQIKPQAAGVAITQDGKRCVIANFENDSITVVDLAARNVAAELDLRPGKTDPAQSGKAGGEFPYWVVIRGNDRAYVSSVRDREVVVVDLGAKPAIAARIPVRGQPNKMVFNRAQTRLYVADDNSDTLAVIDVGANRVIGELGVTAPADLLGKLGGFTGSGPNSVSLSRDERTAYVTLGGANAVSVVRLDASGNASAVEGLIPVAWYPTDAALDPSGKTLLVINGKTNNPGPNPGNCRDTTSKDPDDLDKCHSQNKYILQLLRASLISIPLPSPAELRTLTAQVEANNRWREIAQSNDAADAMSALRGKIHHVIYIIKENRTYDQVLGDLEKGNGDPKLCVLPEPLSPNHHQIARQFVTLDNFMASGEVSGNGWNWSTAARATDYVEKTVPVNYADRGLSYDNEGSNRNIDIGVDGVEARREVNPNLPNDPDLMPGAVNVASPDGPQSARGQGYLWNSALRAGLTVRSYGVFIDPTRTDSRANEPGHIPFMHDPHAQGVVVGFPADPALVGRTDPYYTGFNLKFPDYWRFKEWEREFDEFVANNNLPSLEMVRLGNDHFGDFAGGTDGVNTVETQIGDNDYAIARLLERVANSPYAKDTIVITVEDDAQNGPDHVDAHRTVALMAGAYVKQGAVISTRYTTVSLLRTIEELLGAGRMGLNDAAAAPMADVFTSEYHDWRYTARVPKVLRTTQLPLPPTDAEKAEAPSPYDKPRHAAAWWAAHSKGQNFSVEDAVDTDKFNRTIWLGLAPDGVPFPKHPITGADLSENREQLLAKYRGSSEPPSTPQKQ
jgi:YVTN family beta-propeller protein